ncbi:MAG: ferrous iron transport protein A [Flavobacteriales bacterium]|nr:ferrous iron transport protein A [Flavobacteriales bacterium]
MKLSDLKIGQSAEILSFEKDEIKLRFYEMGCLPGENVKLELVAPLGDPIAIDIRGYLLSLRKNDAKHILVKLS